MPEIHYSVESGYLSYLRNPLQRGVRFPKLPAHEGLNRDSLSQNGYGISSNNWGQGPRPFGRRKTASSRGSRKQNIDRNHRFIWEDPPSNAVETKMPLIKHGMILQGSPRENGKGVNPKKPTSSKDFSSSNHGFAGGFCWFARV